MEFRAIGKNDLFVLEDIRNGMYFKRFAYDGGRKAEVTPHLDGAKTFDDVRRADDYIRKHELEHFEVNVI